MWLFLICFFPSLRFSSRCSVRLLFRWYELTCDYFSLCHVTPLWSLSEIFLLKNISFAYFESTRPHSSCWVFFFRRMSALIWARNGASKFGFYSLSLLEGSHCSAARSTLFECLSRAVSRRLRKSGLSLAVVHAHFPLTFVATASRLRCPLRWVMFTFIDT